VGTAVGSQHVHKAAPPVEREVCDPCCSTRLDVFRSQGRCAHFVRVRCLGYGGRMMPQTMLFPLVSISNPSIQEVKTEREPSPNEMYPREDVEKNRYPSPFRRENERETERAPLKIGLEMIALDATLAHVVPGVRSGTCICAFREHVKGAAACCVIRRRWPCGVSLAGKLSDRCSQDLDYRSLTLEHVSLRQRLVQSEYVIKSMSSRSP